MLLGGSCKCDRDRCSRLQRPLQVFKPKKEKLWLFSLIRNMFDSMNKTDILQWTHVDLWFTNRFRKKHIYNKYIERKWFILILGIPFCGYGDSLYEWNTRTKIRNRQSNYVPLKPNFRYFFNVFILSRTRKISKLLSYQSNYN